MWTIPASIRCASSSPRSASLVMIPDANVGVAVLTNQESSFAFDAIAFRILDHYLDAPAFDWVDAFEKIGQQMQAAERQATARARVRRSP